MPNPNTAVASVGVGVLEAHAGEGDQCAVV
jgi:hypothetical protein